MSLAAQIIDQQISGIAARQEDAFSNELRLGNDVARRRSTAFLFLVAKTVFELSDEETLDAIMDGGERFGVDVLYFEPPEQGELKIGLIQGKYTDRLDSASAFPENAIVRMIDAIRVLFDPRKAVTVNERLRSRDRRRAFVRCGRGDSTRIGHCGQQRFRWTVQAQQRIDEAVSEFGGQVDWRHVGSEDLFSMLQTQKPVDVILQLTGQATVENFEYRRVLMGACRSPAWRKLADEYENRLFERNIRRYLGLVGNRVNEAIAHTLRQPDQRPNFYVYNNGITMTCSHFRHNALQQESWLVHVDGLQIVNGGQTVRTVQQVARDIGADIDNAEILVRLYEIQHNENDLVEEITFATNSRNPVDLRDLKANDPRQKALGASISGLGYVYRAKRDEKPVTANDLTSAVVAEAVLAIWRHRPHQARFRSREHFGALYDRIFTADLNGAQAIIAALLLRYAENRRKRPPPDAPDFLAYGSRFIAMLTGRYLLEEMEIPITRLDHRNFAEARRLVDEKAGEYLSRAEAQIVKALAPLFEGRPPTLQRLSATFRRADLVETLTGASV